MEERMKTTISGLGFRVCNFVRTLFKILIQNLRHLRAYISDLGNSCLHILIIQTLNVIEEHGT